MSVCWYVQQSLMSAIHTRCENMHETKVREHRKQVLDWHTHKIYRACTLPHAYKSCHCAATDAMDSRTHVPTVLRTWNAHTHIIQVQAWRLEEVSPSGEGDDWSSQRRSLSKTVRIDSIGKCGEYTMFGEGNPIDQDGRVTRLVQQRDAKWHISVEATGGFEGG